MSKLSAEKLRTAGNIDYIEYANVDVNVINITSISLAIIKQTQNNTLK